jgi:prepilin-type N-terminal cleavage/methylation domain-containing protein
MVRFQVGRERPKEDTSLKRLSAKGFTLIELLTVIAIISILASMIFIVGPRMIERAKITKWLGTCNEIRTTAAGVFTKKAVGAGSFPPAYGYLTKAIDSQGEMPDKEVYFLTPYVSALRYFHNLDMYDPFARISHDTDNDGSLSLLEFSPVGTPAGPDHFTFSDTRYIFSNASDLANEIASQLSSQRPMLYIPVNLEQAKKVSEYYYMVMKNISLVEGANAMRWDSDDFGDQNPLRGLRLPPPRYDDYVLISVGPAGNTGGIVTPQRMQNGVMTSIPFLAKVRKEDWYHVLALRAYFLATRDLNGVIDPEKNVAREPGNGMLDFDFRNRSRSGEGKPGNYDGFMYIDVPLTGEMCLLPDGTNGPGPLIYMPNKASF